MLTGCIVVATLAGCSDPCRSGMGNYAQLHPENHRFFSCNGRIYYKDYLPKRYQRAAVDVGSFRALPGRFGLDKDHFYFVATPSATYWGYREQRIIPGVDLATAKVVGAGPEYRVQDQDHTFVVLESQIFVLDTVGRPIKELRFDDDRWEEIPEHVPTTTRQ